MDTEKFTKAKQQDDGMIPTTDLAIPFFGYKSHISIDRKYRFIRKWKATHAAASDGARLREKTSWKNRALSPRFTGRSRISNL